MKSVNEEVKLTSESSGSEPAFGKAVAGLEGRELDAAVAMRVMGLPEVERVAGGGFRFCNKQLAEEWGGKWSSPVAHYSTDIAKAMEVWDRLVSNGWLPHLLTMVDGYVVNLHHRDSHHMEQVAADTREEAICRAALSAVLDAVPTAEGARPR